MNQTNSETKSAWLTGNIDIEQILSQISSKENISDIHLATDEPISFRINWEIKKMENLPILKEDMMEMIVKQLMKWNQKAFEQFLADKEADFSYIWSDDTPYRVNTFLKLWKIWVVLRKIDSKAKELKDLMFDDTAASLEKRILAKESWLFLVTWPTGSWKSTTLVAMIEYLNKTRNSHIITIEDPVEFVFNPEKSVVSQREVWHDSRSFMNALRWAMREDPDIVLVWEVRDKETAEAVLNLAETGHLVFSTLHTSSASGTVNRLISLFPPEIQWSISDRLADALLWVQSQRLLKTADGKWRAWLFEIMINTPAVANNIRKKQLSQIDNIIETWMKQWMINFQQYAKRLVDDWIIREKSVDRLLSE